MELYAELISLIYRDYTSFYKNFHLCKIEIIKSLNMGGEKMSNALENFDFLELGQAIQDAREKQRITREELAEELGISATELQSFT